MVRQWFGYRFIISLPINKEAPKMATVKPKYSNEVYKSLRDIMFGVDSVYNLTKGEVKNLVELYVQTELNGDIDEYNKANERRIAKYKEAIESGRTNSMYYKIAERNLEEVKKVWLSTFFFENICRRCTER